MRSLLALANYCQRFIPFVYAFDSCLLHPTTIRFLHCDVSMYDDSGHVASIHGTFKHINCSVQFNVAVHDNQIMYTY